MNKCKRNCRCCSEILEAPNEFRFKKQNNNNKKYSMNRIFLCRSLVNLEFISKILFLDQEMFGNSGFYFYFLRLWVFWRQYNGASVQLFYCIFVLSKNCCWNHNHSFVFIPSLIQNILSAHLVVFAFLACS